MIFIYANIIVRSYLLAGLQKQILIVAAVITPSPDWTSQTIVAVPLIILYEISIFISKRVDKKRIKAEAQWD